MQVLPTIACILNSKTRDYIVGFDDLGGVDDFPTEMLEWRLSISEMLNYNGDKPALKGKTQEKVFGYVGRKTKGIKGNDDDSDDSDLDY